jgi:integrase/recombinase XerD
MKNDRSTRKLPDILTEDGCTRLQNASNRRYPSGTRDYALIVTMLNTALRISEALNIKWSDILDWHSGEVIIKDGKGGYDRKTYLNEKVRDAILAWRDIRPEAAQGSEYVFSNLKGNHLAVQHVQRTLKRLAKRAGIARNVHPHLLRHTAATHFYQKSGYDIRMTQQFCGHHALSSTQLYTRISPRELREKMLAFTV